MKRQDFVIRYDFDKYQLGLIVGVYLLLSLIALVLNVEDGVAAEKRAASYKGIAA